MKKRNVSTASRPILATAHEKGGVFILLLALSTLPVAGPTSAQPQDPSAKELIVLLAPSPPAPTAQSIVNAVNNSTPIPGGIDLGSPDYAEMLASQPPTGRLAQLIAENPDSPEARLFRYFLVGYRSENSIDVDAVAASLAVDTNVQSVEENLPIRFHASRLPTKVVPSDELVGTGASLPDAGQWALHLLNLPAAWDWTTAFGYLSILDLGLQVDHEDLKVFGTDPVTGQLTLGPFREHLSEDVAFGGCGVDESEEGDDTVGHGTHVSGIVASRSNNHRGSAGV